MQVAGAATPVSPGFAQQELPRCFCQPAGVAGCLCWVAVGNGDVLPILLPFSTFVTFLCLFQSEGKNKKKKTHKNPTATMK